MNVDITIEKDEHPYCFGRDCEGDHWQENVHVKIGKTTLVLLEGSKDCEFLKHLAKKFKIEKKYQPKHGQLFRADTDCKCGQRWYIQKMLSELEEGMMKCQHDGKTRDLKGKLLE